MSRQPDTVGALELARLKLMQHQLLVLPRRKLMLLLVWTLGFGAVFGAAVGYPLAPTDHVRSERCR